MGTAEPVLDLLTRALDQTAVIIAGIRPGQADRPTPCPEWTVRDLVRHVVAKDLRNFTAAARGELADWQAPAEDLDPDWAADFRTRAAALLDVWRTADLDRPVPSMGGAEAPLRSRADQQIAELATHGWDLVKATGQSTDLDPDLAEHALTWSKGMLRPEYRGPDKAFGPEITVPADAPPYDRLAAWFGRTPTWTPPA